MARRVVITSIGVISSLGVTPGEIVATLKEGGASFTRPSFDEEAVICPVNGFALKAFTGRYKDARYLNRGASFGVASAMAASANAGIPEDICAKAGLFVGGGPNFDIGSEFPEIASGKIEDKGLAALWILKFLPNTAASAIARLTGVHGENLTIGTACSASLQAIGEAYRKIKDGYLDMAFAGGGDSRLNPGGVFSYKKAQALFTGDGNPECASRPFDESRKGFIPGEGGAFFILESLAHAQQRNARIHAEIRGFGASMDGFNMTAPDPQGKWAEIAVRSALGEANLTPSHIDVISSHGTSTPLNDEMESRLIDRVFGYNKPFIIALKSWIGHLASACGAVELAIFLICLENHILPAIRNLKKPCLEGLNFVRETRSYSAKTILLENFGFGGQNSALIVRRWTESP